MCWFFPFFFLLFFDRGGYRVLNCFSLLPCNPFLSFIERNHSKHIHKTHLPMPKRLLTERVCPPRSLAETWCCLFVLMAGDALNPDSHLELRKCSGKRAY